MASAEAKQAEQLFMQGMTPAEIEAQTGIPANKIRAWKSRYKWGGKIVAQRPKAQQTKTQQRNATMPKAPRPTGRPTVEIDKRAFENLCGMQATREEIADFFDIDSDTVNAWCKREYGESFSAVYKKRATKGKVSLRRSQFLLAEKNASMAIFLGKNYLGQSDDGLVGRADDREIDPLSAALAELAGELDKDASPK